VKALGAVLVLFLAVVSGPAAAAAPIDGLLADLQIVPLGGQTPPPLVGEGLDGKRVSLADLRGRAVLLYFWATW
jgi:hypothetical protein